MRILIAEDDQVLADGLLRTLLPAAGDGSVAPDLIAPCARGACVAASISLEELAAGSSLETLRAIQSGVFMPVLYPRNAV